MSVDVPSGTTEKKSVTIPVDVIAAAQAFSGERGFSAYTTKALRAQIAHDNLALLADEMADRFGPVAQADRDQVRADLAAALDAVQTR